MSLLALAAIGLAQSQTYVFERGGRPSAEGGLPKYHGVQDTTLDSRAANVYQGAGFELQGGEGRTVLIRFGDLAAWLPKNAVIEEASLELTSEGSESPALVGASKVLVPWGEGPAALLRIQLAGTAGAPDLAATWNHRYGGKDPIAWQRPGAQGASDAEPLQGLTSAPIQRGIRIDGLRDLVQSWTDLDEENFGLALRINGSFSSSQAPSGRPRLIVKARAGSPSTGPNLAIEWVQPKTEPAKRLRNGDSVVYVARVRNLGDAPASPFQAQWLVRGRLGGAFSVPQSLAPGASMDLEYPTRAVIAADPRVGQIGLRLLPGADAVPQGNRLEVYEAGTPVRAGGSFLAAQAALRRLNEVVFPESKFSFAVDGVTARYRLVEGEGAELTLDPARPDAIADLLRSAGLSYRFDAKVQFTGGSTPRGLGAWRSGWLTGDGDTRFDGALPGLLTLPYEPWFDPVIDAVPLEASGLLSATDVAFLNGGLTRKQEPGEVLADLPGTVILKALYRNGEPIPGAELTFFQSKDGSISDAEPAFSVVTGDSGTALLPNRDLGQSGPIQLPSGRTLKPNPFGRVAFDGSNGTFLVRALVNGAEDWGVLKIWQLVDAYHRGAQAACLFDMRFNVPNVPLDALTNLAKERPTTDSAGSLPAQTAAVVDGDPATGLALGEKAGDWVEIDLGRDRPIGEVRLVLGESAAPEQFELVAYATGQNAGQMNAWVRERDSGWTLRNRSTIRGGLPCLTYRGPAVRVRYLRVRNVSGGKMLLREIEAVAAK